MRHGHADDRGPGDNAWLPAMVMRPSRGSTSVGLADGYGWRSGPNFMSHWRIVSYVTKIPRAGQHRLYDAKV